jgi:hypothetical protein
LQEQLKGEAAGRVTQIAEQIKSAALVELEAEKLKLQKELEEYKATTLREAQAKVVQHATVLDQAALNAEQERARVAREAQELIDKQKAELARERDNLRKQRDAYEA